MCFSVNFHYESKSGEHFYFFLFLLELLQVNLPDATFLLVSQGCPFAMVSTASLPPSGVLSGSTPPHALKSVKVREKEKKREKE